jgi:purine nucleosidase
MSTPVIIDTDTGIDDAMGCVLALVRPELSVVGMTSVFGNTTVENTTRNTATLLEQLERRDVALARGAARGFVGTPRFNPEIHGADGVGDAGFPDPVSVYVEPVPAAQFIVETARSHPGKLTFIALGPLTNLALALLLEPELPKLLPRIVWMGGAVRMPGNVSPVAEADALHDPEAAQLVLDAGWKVQLVSLDVTDDTLLEQTGLERLQRSAAPSRIVPFYMDFYSPLLGKRACAMHSALTVGIVARPELIVQQEELPLAIELNRGLTRGMTVADRRPGRQYSPNREWMRAPLVSVVTEVDRSSFAEMFLTSVGA